MRDHVPDRALPAAVTLNSAAFNVSRAVGPVVGGALLPLFTAVGTFSFAAVAAAVLLVALARSPQTRESPDGVERRRLLPAIAAGMSYALRTPAPRPIPVRTIGRTSCRESGVPSV